MGSLSLRDKRFCAFAIVVFRQERNKIFCIFCGNYLEVNIKLRNFAAELGKIGK